jgi:hypothetical protein
MPLLLKFHGALTTVTGSCHFFKVKASGNIYAVDCGATQGEDDDEQLALPRNLPRDCTPDYPHPRARRPHQPSPAMVSGRVQRSDLLYARNS